jgi:hypothetical protein
MQPVAVPDKKGLDFFPRLHKNSLNEGGMMKKGTLIAILKQAGIMPDDSK